MANNEHPIDALIKNKLAEIDEGEKKIDRRKIELATLRQAREAVPDPGNKRRNSRTKRQRSLSGNWKRVLTFIAHKAHEGASIDEIIQFGNRASLNIHRETLRSQMSIYSKSGFVQRVKPGVFAFSAPGGLALADNKDQGNDNAAPGEGGGKID